MLTNLIPFSEMIHHIKNKGVFRQLGEKALINVLASSEMAVQSLLPWALSWSEWLIGSETKAGDCSVMAPVLCPWVCCTSRRYAL